MMNVAARRLPIYVMIDCSQTMQGSPIVAVNEGLELLVRELMNDPMSRETAWLSLITFADQAQQFPLTPVDAFVPPHLNADGHRYTGAALELLYRSLMEDLVVTTTLQRGDYRPLVYLLTDGAPEDAWRDVVEQLHSLRGSRKPTIVALGCGENISGDTLAIITPNVFLMKNTTPDTIRQFFQVISGSILSPSQAMSGKTNQDQDANFFRL